MREFTMLLTTDDMPRLSSISGNVDVDKLTPFIYTAQKNKVRKVLGVPLYNKIIKDFEDDTLTGYYKVIYEEFVADMLIYYACADFIALGTFEITNAGVFRYNADNGDAVETTDLNSLVLRYSSLGDAVVRDYQEYLKTVSIAEVQTTCSSGNSLGLNWYI